jgi:hypothetical protein
LLIYLSNETSDKMVIPAIISSPIKLCETIFFFLGIEEETESVLDERI